MHCSYYTKFGFFRRLRGTMGYCELQKCNIIREDTVGKIPYAYCEGIKGKSNVQCGVFLHFSNKRRDV
ncbi:MAG: hypothetical protein N3B21_12835 [Clostridia bacterium]|nr:hypothetical protein [Clostridia bacterium]